MEKKKKKSDPLLGDRQVFRYSVPMLSENLHYLPTTPSISFMYWLPSWYQELCNWEHLSALHQQSNKRDSCNGDSFQHWRWKLGLQTFQASMLPLPHISPNLVLHIHIYNMNHEVVMPTVYQSLTHPWPLSSVLADFISLNPYQKHQNVIAPFHIQ